MGGITAKVANAELGLTPATEASRNSSDTLPTFKIVILGASRVGKTALLHRLLKNTFPTTSSEDRKANFGVKRVQVEGCPPAVCEICDIPVKSGSPELFQEYVRGAAAAILVYAVDDASSSNALVSAYESLLSIFPPPPLGKLNQVSIPVLIAANKLDVLKDGAYWDQVVLTKVRDWAQRRNLVHLACSAKDGTMVPNVLSYLVSRLQQQRFDCVDRDGFARCAPWSIIHQQAAKDSAESQNLRDLVGMLLKSPVDPMLLKELGYHFLGKNDIRKATFLMHLAAERGFNEDGNDFVLRLARCHYIVYLSTGEHFNLRQSHHYYQKWFAEGNSSNEDAILVKVELADVYRLLGHHVDAIESMMTVAQRIQSYGKMHVLQLKLAECYVATKQFEKAISSLRQVQHVPPAPLTSCDLELVIGWIEEISSIARESDNGISERDIYGEAFRSVTFPGSSRGFDEWIRDPNLWFSTAQRLASSTCLHFAADLCEKAWQTSHGARSHDAVPIPAQTIAILGELLHLNYRLARVEKVEEFLTLLSTVFRDQADASRIVTDLTARHNSSFEREVVEWNNGQAQGWLQEVFVSIK